MSDHVRLLTHDEQKLADIIGKLGLHLGVDGLIDVVGLDESDRRVVKLSMSQFIADAGCLCGRVHEANYHLLEVVK